MPFKLVFMQKSNTVFHKKFRHIALNFILSTLSIWKIKRAVESAYNSVNATMDETFLQQLSDHFRTDSARAVVEDDTIERNAR